MSADSLSAISHDWHQGGGFWVRALLKAIHLQEWRNKWEICRLLPQCTTLWSKKTFLTHFLWPPFTYQQTGMQGFYINVFCLWMTMLTNQNYINMVVIMVFCKWIITDALWNFRDFRLHFLSSWKLFLSFKLDCVRWSEKGGKHCRYLYICVLLWGFCLFS